MRVPASGKLEIILSLPEIKSGRTGDAILPGAAWQ